MVYSFQEDMDDFTPSGEYTYLFRHFGSHELQEVEADSSSEAFEHLRYEIDGDWSEWLCLGRKDIVEYKMEVHDFETPMDAKCSTTGLHPIDFAKVNEDLVEQWDEEDEE